MERAALSNEFLIEADDGLLAIARVAQCAVVKLTSDRNYNFFLSRHDAVAEIKAVGKNIEETWTMSGERIFLRDCHAALRGKRSDRVLM